eukprot:SAG22_NODE_154_length_17189_cov_38.210064_9_plen_247_part_00
MCEAIIFDMDGLMIDSEPLWHVAETAVFASVGVTLSEDNCNETTGLRIDEVVAHHFERQGGWDESKHPQSAVAEGIIDKMEELYKVQAQELAKPGLRQCLEFFKSTGLPIAVASSSPVRLIDAALVGLGLDKGFFVKTYSAQFEEFGKPHPGVYLSVCRQPKVYTATLACPPPARPPARSPPAAAPSTASSPPRPRLASHRRHAGRQGPRGAADQVSGARGQPERDTRGQVGPDEVHCDPRGAGRP